MCWKLRADSDQPHCSDKAVGVGVGVELGEVGRTAGTVPLLARCRRSLEAKGNDVPSLIINILPKAIFLWQLIQRPRCL